MTIRSTAIYNAKAAFAFMQMRGVRRDLVRFHTLNGARYSFTDPASGFQVILKHAADYAMGGAVDAALTKQANQIKGTKTC